MLHGGYDVMPYDMAPTVLMISRSLRLKTLTLGEVLFLCYLLTAHANTATADLLHTLQYEKMIGITQAPRSETIEPSSKKCKSHHYCHQRAFIGALGCGGRRSVADLGTELGVPSRHRSSFAVGRRCLSTMYFYGC